MSDVTRTREACKGAMHCIVRKDLAVDAILATRGDRTDHVGRIDVFDIGVWDFTLENSLQVPADVGELGVARVVVLPCCG